MITTFESILRQFQSISQQQLSHLQHVTINALFLELDALLSSTTTKTTNSQQTPVTSGLRFENLFRQDLAVFDIVFADTIIMCDKQNSKALFLLVLE